MKNWNIKLDLGDSKGKTLESLLKSRGIDEKDYEEFLNPLENNLSSPYVFSDMKKAKERIEKAVQNKELILIWGDFDADGVTSTSILYKTFTALGANFDYIIPDRENMGHGINSNFILKYISKNKPKVLITVDCGISNDKEISLVKNFGVDVILTDHHKAPETLPEAYAIINPKAPDSLDSTLSVAEINRVSELAGAGVAHKLATALLEDVDNKQLKDEILILAAVGTIADVVPLLYENRTLAAKGLSLINKGVHKGIDLLFKANSKTENITSYDVAFILSPRINAAGRLADTAPAFKLLTEDDENVLKASLKELDNYNRIRQNLCDKIFEEALGQIQNNKNFKNEKAIVLFDENWHLGVIGIVASKLVEKFYKPVFIMTKDDKDMARCSIRGIKGYSVAEILDENSGLFDGGFGGHALAGGCSFDLNKTPFEKVKAAILNTFNEKEDVKLEGPSVDIDFELNTEDINEDLISAIEKLEPTGQDNPAPVFCIRDAKLIFKKTMGKENNHLTFKIKKDGKDLNCIWWRHNTISPEEGESLDLAFQAKLNMFNNEASIRLYAVDLKCEKDSLKPENLDVKFYDHRMKDGILGQIEEYLKRPNIDIDIHAKKIKTKTFLKDYPVINSKIKEDDFSADDIMFFDYPPSMDEFVQILKEKFTQKGGRVHLMKEEFDTNIENYIKQLIGMLKYSTNNKDGEIHIKNFAGLIGVSEDFIQGALDILEEIGSIEILDIDKIKFLTPPVMDSFYKHSNYNGLKEEFDKIIEFKNYAAKINICDIEKLIFSD